MRRPRKGVVYLFCGISYAERFVTALYTLRKHWDGLVTVGVTDDECEKIIKRIQQDIDGIDILRVEKAQSRRHSAYATKSAIPTWAPYRRNVFLDGDTIVVGQFRELFGPRLSITHFSDWHSQGRRVSGRIKRWEGLSPAIDRLLKIQLSQRRPAINTGVIGFHKHHLPLAEWHAITQAGLGKIWSDELAMQLLTSSMTDAANSDQSKVKIFDDRWNHSVIYGRHHDDVRIWHCHGDKHVRKEAGRKIWWPVFQEVCRLNIGGIVDWAGQYDRRLRKHMAEIKVTPRGIASESP